MAPSSEAGDGVPDLVRAATGNQQIAPPHPDARFAQLLEDAAGLAQESRAPATRRGYDSDMADFRIWCRGFGRSALPSDIATVAAYITWLAASQAAVGTISRRLSSIRHYHVAAGFPDPASSDEVRYVFAGIRNRHGRAPDRATPLKPPFLFDVLDACPTVFETKSGRREPRLAGLRDRALLIVGFVGALRRSELVAAQVEDLREDPRGLLLEIPRSKTNQDGAEPELVVLPRSQVPAHCPVTLLQAWLEASRVTEGPLFQAVTTGNAVRDGGLPLSADRANQIVRTAVARAGVNPLEGGFSAHSLRAGFATHAAERGVSDRAIQRQTRHRHTSTVRIYTRHESAWTDNAATQLGL